jgi:hypothetical protein
VAVYKRKDRDTWVARLSGPDGRLVQKNFARKTDAGGCPESRGTSVAARDH